MLLEKEIQKTYFRNNQHRTMLNIFHTSVWLAEKLRDLLSEDQLTPQQYNILRILHVSDKPLSTLRIREMLIDKMSDTSRLVERLIKKGLVTKQVNEHDKRLVDVKLSKKGQEVFAVLEQKVSAIDSVMEKLSDSDMLLLNQLLNKIKQ